ncbi:hypothetical protein BGZ83_004401 [Gryganskiella cystojenkinii]|nr:hypothetical protein BGZ83_004401 [Gryganskiella cystojenkinii]
MKVFLTITTVLSLTLLSAGQTAFAQSVNGQQVVFGGHRPHSQDPFQVLDGVTKVSYPPELRNHALVRFNGRKHHDVSFHNFGLIRNEDPLEDMLDHLDVWSRSEDSEDILVHMTARQFESFERVMRYKGVPEREGDWVVVERNLQELVDREADAITTRNIENRIQELEEEKRLTEIESESEEEEAGGLFFDGLSQMMKKKKNKKEKKPKKRVNLDTWFTNYHTHEEIKEFFLQLVDDYPDFVTFIPSIGQTIEGRDIFAVRITAKNTNDSAKEKPQIWWQGLQHAREWAGGSTVQFLVHHFLSNYGKNAKVTDALNKAELVIVPVMNVDGYEYTWKNNRLWRKNRRQNSLGAWGIDLNRNWDDHFDEGGSSGFPWSETYHGPSAASEPEVQAMQKFFGQQKRIVGAIDFHCYSQLVLRPNGWTAKPSAHEQEQKYVGDEIVRLIKSVHGKKYISEPSIALYKTTGSASDYFYGDKATADNNGQKIYSYTIELRPSDTNPGGRSGFILPPEEIIPLGEEIAKAMEFFVNHAVDNPLES